MPDDKGCGEGCRTYIDAAFGKTVVGIILITFIVALIFGILAYNETLNAENETAGVMQETPVFLEDDLSTAGINLTERTGAIVNKNTVGIFRLNTTDDFFVLKNYGSEPVKISGWKVADKNGEHIFTFPDVSLRPQQTITVYSGAAAPSNDQKGVIFWTQDEIWDDSGDQAVLYNNLGEEVDRKS